MKNKLRILHTESSKGWGGQEIRTINEIKSLKDKIDYFLIAPKGSCIYKEAHKLNIKVAEAPFVNKSFFSSIYKIFMFALRNKIDCIHTHSGKDTWVGGIVAKILNLKHIRTRHIHIIISPNSYINRLSDFIITTGSKIRENLIKITKIKDEKVLSIPTGVDMSYFNLATIDKATYKREFGMSPSKLAIGIMCVLRGWKNVSLFVDIAALNTDLDIEFYVAGDGNQRKHLEKKAMDLKLNNIKFLGHVNPKSFLGAIDIFLYTSNNDGVPQVVTQALAMSLPVITKLCGSVKDLKKDDNMIIVDSGDKEEFNLILRELVSDASKMRRLSVNARESVKIEFDIDSFASRVKSLYDKVMLRDCKR